MTPDKLALLAEDALQLKTNPAFVAVSDEMRQMLMKRLALVDATNADEIRRLQAGVQAVDSLLDGLNLLATRKPRIPCAVA